KLAIGLLPEEIARLRAFERTLLYSSFLIVLNLLPLDFGEYFETISALSLLIAIAALKVLPNFRFFIVDCN
ncbi:MAG: hypothetical protein ACK55I_08545, partial [bacterium]